MRLSRRGRSVPITVVAATVMLVGTAISTAIAGCAVPGEGEARPIVLNGTDETSTPATPQPGSVKEILYLVRDDQLVRVERRLRTAPGIETVLAHLLAGPTAAERDRGLTSSLLGRNLVAGVTLVDRKAFVELTPGETVRTDDVLAFAQVVCTLSARPDVDGVTFTLDQQETSVPRSDGSLSSGPLSEADYASLVAGG